MLIMFTYMYVHVCRVTPIELRRDSLYVTPDFTNPFNCLFQFVPDHPIFLVGMTQNNMKQKRLVSTEQGREKAIQLSMDFMEVNVKDKTVVEQACASLFAGIASFCIMLCDLRPSGHPLTKWLPFKLELE